MLHGIDLTIAPGSGSAWLGRPGPASPPWSTCCCTFYDPAGGRILIDGQDIADVTQESLRAHIAMVTQDTSLLHRSIRENISYGRPQRLRRRDHRRRRDRPQAHDFILGLEDWHGRTATTPMSGNAG